MFLFVDYLEYGECFEQQNMSTTFHYKCRLEAETAVQQEPGYDYCKSVVIH